MKKIILGISLTCALSMPAYAEYESGWENPFLCEACILGYNQLTDIVAAAGTDCTNIMLRDAWTDAVNNLAMNISYDANDVCNRLGADAANCTNEMLVFADYLANSNGRWISNMCLNADRHLSLGVMCAGDLDGITPCLMRDGYYAVSDGVDGDLGVAPCPAPGTSMGGPILGRAGVSQCFIPANTELNDASGTYVYTAVCRYSR